MNQIPNIEETHNTREEFATQLSKSVRYSSGRGQYDAFPDCQDAYLDGVETAIAMMYIDLTGTPKSEGMLAKFLHHQLQKAREQERERIASIKAVEILKNQQEQCDQDGIMVRVSRQALDELLDELNQITDVINNKTNGF